MAAQQVEGRTEARAGPKGPRSQTRSTNQPWEVYRMPPAKDTSKNNFLPAKGQSR